MVNPPSLEDQTLEALTRSHISHFKDKTSFSRALELIEAWEVQAPQNIKVWLLKTYAFLLLDSPEQAVRSLKQAQNLNPDHPDVKAYWEYLQGHDHQETYDTLADYFQQTSEDLLNDVLQLPKDTQTENLKKRKENHTKLCLRFKTLEAHQASLNHSGEYMGLAQQLDPIAVALNHEKRLLTLSEKMQMVLHAIEEGITCLRKLSVSSALSENELEEWINQSDVWADILENWQAQGYPCRDIEDTYTRFVTGLQLLLDGLDD